MASRNRLAPQVIAYWFTSASIAALAASFSSGGHGKSGNPCDRLIASCSSASRVISRMTDSVNDATFELTRGILGLLSRAGPGRAYRRSGAGLLQAEPGGDATLDLLGSEGSLRSEEHTSELQSPYDLECRLLLEKKKK